MELWEMLEMTPPDLPYADSYIEPQPSEICYVLDVDGVTPWHLT